MESGTGGAHEEAAEAATLQKWQKSTSKPTGVGYVVVEVIKTGQEK